MFDGVARRYDVTNTVLSFAQDRRWRRRTRQVLQVRPGDRVLDLAAGTGVSTVELARGGAAAIACDFSIGMLRAGRAVKKRRHVPFVAGDATCLPFGDAAFDSAVISFGLPHVSHVPRAPRGLAPGGRPGGRPVLFRVSRPPRRPVPVRYLKHPQP